MDNFNLKEYLSNNRLLTEGEDDGSDIRGSLAQRKAEYKSRFGTMDGFEEKTPQITKTPSSPKSYEEFIKWIKNNTFHSGMMGGHDVDNSSPYKVVAFIYGMDEDKVYNDLYKTGRNIEENESDD